MMDCIMLAVLAVSCGTMLLLIGWCHRQISSEE